MKLWPEALALELDEHLRRPGVALSGGLHLGALLSE